MCAIRKNLDTQNVSSIWYTPLMHYYLIRSYVKLHPSFFSHTVTLNKTSGLGCIHLVLILLLSESVCFALHAGTYLFLGVTLGFFDGGWSLVREVEAWIKHRKMLLCA